MCVHYLMTVVTVVVTRCEGKKKQHSKPLMVCLNCVRLFFVLTCWWYKTQTCSYQRCYNNMMDVSSSQRDLREPSALASLVFQCVVVIYTTRCPHLCALTEFVSIASEPHDGRCKRKAFKKRFHLGMPGPFQAAEPSVFCVEKKQGCLER